MVWNVKNDSDIDPFNLDRNALRREDSIRILNKCLFFLMSSGLIQDICVGTI